MCISISFTQNLFHLYVKAKCGFYSSACNKLFYKVVFTKQGPDETTFIASLARRSSENGWPCLHLWVCGHVNTVCTVLTHNTQTQQNTWIPYLQSVKHLHSRKQPCFSVFQCSLTMTERDAGRHSNGPHAGWICGMRQTKPTSKMLKWTWFSTTPGLTTSL